MNTRIAFCLIASLALITGPLCRAEKEGGIEHNMEMMGKALRILKRGIADASQKASNLEAIDRLKKGATASRDGIPEKAEKIPQADRAKFIEDYRLSISELVTQIEKLEKAVKEDRLQDAQKELDELNELKRDGHATFAEKKEK